MKNIVQYNHTYNCWMIRSQDGGFLGSAMKERDAMLFALAHEMFDVLKRFRDEVGIDYASFELMEESAKLINQIEPILSINNGETP